MKFFDRSSKSFPVNAPGTSPSLGAGAEPSSRAAIVTLLLGVPAVYAGVAALGVWFSSPDLLAGRCAGLALDCSLSPRDSTLLLAILAAIVVVPVLLGVFLIVVARVRRKSKLSVAVALLGVEVVAILILVVL